MKPKILHIEVGGTYGGSTRALELYLRHCNPHLFDHHILFYFPTPNWEEFTGLAQRASVLFHESPAHLSRQNPNQKSLIDRAIHVLSTAYALRKYFMKGKYDLIHVNNTFTYQLPSVIAAVLAGKPVVAHIRNPVSWIRMTCALAHRTSCLVSVNRHFAEEAAFMGVGCDIYTCYDGVLVSVPHSAAVRASREQLARHDHFLIGAVGRLNQQKGYEYLVRAARIVVERHRHVQFVIAGEGPERCRLERLIKELSLENNFRLLGFRQDSATVIASLDLLVSSSLWEGLPLAILEAMVLGKPMVATDVGGTSEIVHREQNGMLVPPRNPEALARAITRLITDQARLQAYGLRSRELVIPYMDLHSVASSFDRVLSDLDFRIRSDKKVPRHRNKYLSRIG